MAFKPGESGNPGGRPKECSEVKELARQYGPEAINKLLALMRGEDARVAKAAADSILDRAYGKPGQSVDLVADLTAHISAVERRIVRPKD
jgi:hypothetical protein